MGWPSPAGDLPNGESWKRSPDGVEPNLCGGAQREFEEFASNSEWHNASETYLEPG